MQDPRITRRHVLKAGCAAVAVPSLVPASALGRADAAPPSERVTFGHIGVGGRGTLLFKAAQTRPDVHSVAVADCYEDRREEKAQLIDGTAYADFREILDRQDIDAVIVATPDHWHVPIALLAARAGKDAYVEKPLGLTLQQTVACQKVFEQEGRMFQYGTQQREAEHMKRGREIYQSGKLGEIRAIEVIAPDGGTGGDTTESPVPEGFDYDMWLGPAPIVPYTVDRCVPKGTYWIYDQSIGYLGGWGAHPLDILVWCYDGDLAGPYTVEGTGKVPTEGLYDTVYNWDMTLRMADGVKVTFKPGPNSTKFIGTEGKLELTRSSIRAFPEALIDGIEAKNVHTDNAAQHIQSLADAVRSRKPASSPVEDAVRSDVMSHLCDIAVRTGEKITWDPTQQKIVGGSPKARAMASRPMRAPWTL